MTPDAEVLEPEVIPPGEAEPREAENTDPGGVNLILAGLVVDVLRFVTVGPIGFIAGGIVGFLTARSNRVPFATALVIAVASGAYCSLPPVGKLPVATVVGTTIMIWRKLGK